jgi:hypothetical protein
LNRSTCVAGVLTILLASWVEPARGQVPAPAQAGKPPADLAQTVTAPTGADAPTLAAPATDSTNAAVSAGGQFAAGNSKLFAATGLGKFDMRRGDNGFGAQLVGNYAEGAIAPSTTLKTTTENLQGKLRYDRYFTPAFGAFLQLTGTHDAFQAITFRLNVDPGVKLFFYDQPSTKFWGELGYDFEFDQNFVDSNGIEQAGSGGPAFDGSTTAACTKFNAAGCVYVIQSQNTIHSTRLFAGLKHSFNKDVQLYFGLEYLQGLGGTGTGTPAVPNGYAASEVDLVPISVTGARLNGDALLAASIGGGFSIGIGLSEKFNSAPLAGKQNLDSTGTLSLIYAFSSPSPAPPPACPDVPPPPPPPADGGAPPSSPASPPSDPPAPPPAVAPSSAPAPAPVPPAPPPGDGARL